MKTKKNSKRKLVLTKKTIADLSNTDLRQLYGGDRITEVVTKCITNCLMCPSVKCR